MRQTKGVKTLKKTDNNDGLRLVDLKKKSVDMERIKWKDFKMYHLIAIQGEMDEKFTKPTIKQGENIKT